MTPKESRFCLEYVSDFNATQAAKRAGYSAKTARSIGSENLSKPDIRAEIKRLCDEAVGHKKDLLRLRVFTELESIAFAKELRTGERLRALDILAKYVGMLKNETDIQREKDEAFKRNILRNADTEVKKMIEEYGLLDFTY